MRISQKLGLAATGLVAVVLSACSGGGTPPSTPLPQPTSTPYAQPTSTPYTGLSLAQRKALLDRLLNTEADSTGVQEFPVNDNITRRNDSAVYEGSEGNGSIILQAIESSYSDGTGVWNCYINGTAAGGERTSRIIDNGCDGQVDFVSYVLVGFNSTIQSGLTGSSLTFYISDWGNEQYGIGLLRLANAKGIGTPPQ
jgi:hypothetical protein